MNYWVDFVPLIIGMLIHQLMDHAERHRELQREIETLQKEHTARVE